MEEAIIIPCYNSSKTILPLLKRIRKVTNAFIIAVDDGSVDSTFSTLKKFKDKNFLAVKLEKNRGVGYATRVGIKIAQKIKAKKVLTIDADLQHPPESIPDFFKALEKHKIVLGYRKFGLNRGIIREIGDMILNLELNFLFFKKFKDTQCGMRAFLLDAIKKINFQQDGYEFISEFIIKTRDLDYYEIPIPAIYPSFPSLAIKRGIKIFIYILSQRFFS
ncbi:MAG: glycosyltransferase family 2 protein [Candidatus Micrarchaeia archaeon]